MAETKTARTYYSLIDNGRVVLWVVYLQNCELIGLIDAQFGHKSGKPLTVNYKTVANVMAAQLLTAWCCVASIMWDYTLRLCSHGADSPMKSQTFHCIHTVVHMTRVWSGPHWIVVGHFSTRKPRQVVTSHWLGHLQHRDIELQHCGRNSRVSHGFSSKSVNGKSIVLMSAKSSGHSRNLCGGCIRRANRTSQWVQFAAFNIKAVQVCWG